MMREDKQSLIGVRFDNDQAVVETTHRDGRTEQHPLESEKIDTQTPQPQTWRKGGGSPLVEKDVHGLTRQQRVDQSVRIEATLLKCLSTTSNLDPKEHSDKMMIEVLNAMGGEWKNHIDKFKRRT